ncbi:MAG: GGDEF domain-containing protein [Pseudomonadota bacterium]
MGHSAVLLGHQSKRCKKIFKVFSDQNHFQVTDFSERKELPLSKDSSFQQADIVFFGGETVGEHWEFVQALRSENPWLPVLVLAKGKEAKDIQDSEVLVRVVSPTIEEGQMVKLAERLCAFSIQAQKPRVASANQVPQGGLAGDFFQTLDIHQVLDKTLNHFGSKILCHELHWIHWDEVLHLSKADSESLSLELETKYHKTPRLRSWRGEHDIEHAVRLVRDFPLAKNLDRLENAGYLILVQQGVQHLLFPLMGSKGNLSCLLVEDLHDGEPEFIVKMMRESLTHLARHIEFSYQYYEATNLSYLDDLTELYNQRYLPQVLDNEISRARRNEKKFAVLFMDVDHFKKVNDSKGHWIGSKLLVEIGKIVKGQIRSCDYGFRYGGDEYVVVLVDTDTNGAKIVAERLRSEIEESAFLIDGQKVSLTVSIGLATYPDHAATRQEVIQMADEAMYCGKNASRNIVFVAS